MRKIREENERKALEEAEKKNEEYPDGRHGDDLIKREQVVQMIREMMKANQVRMEARSFYGATLAAGWGNCLKYVESRVKAMDSAPVTEPAWKFLQKRFEKVI